MTTQRYSKHYFFSDTSTSFAWQHSRAMHSLLCICIGVLSLCNPRSTHALYLQILGPSQTQDDTLLMSVSENYHGESGRTYCNEVCRYSCQRVGLATGLREESSSEFLRCWLASCTAGLVQKTGQMRNASSRDSSSCRTFLCSVFTKQNSIIYYRTSTILQSVYCVQRHQYRINARYRCQPAHPRGQFVRFRQTGERQ